MSTKDDMLARAYNVKLRSPDPSTQVGAVITAHLGDGTERVLGEGFNDFPPGVPEHFWHVRPTKYLYVVHAEVDALRDAARHTCIGGTIYVTHHPCKDCAKLIVAFGLKKVVCPEKPWRDDPVIAVECDLAKTIFKQCGVEMDYV